MGVITINPSTEPYELKVENREIKGYAYYEVGSLCEIRPCGDEYENKSYLGIYLGELPIAILSWFYEKDRLLKNSTLDNPAIFVPELKKIIYGCESWWHIIDSVDDFKGITDENIQNTWYVKLLKELSKEGKQDV